MHYKNCNKLLIEKIKIILIKKDIYNLKNSFYLTQNSQKN